MMFHQRQEADWTLQVSKAKLRNLFIHVYSVDFYEYFFLNNILLRLIKQTQVKIKTNMG